MRAKIIPEEVDVWIDNWCRKEHVSATCRSWLESFPFIELNIITNHSSISLENFDEDIRGSIKIWNNELRHDSSVGPITENINKAYIHSFLNGKKYCVFAHDGIVAKTGWAEVLKDSDYDLYIVDSDRIHI